MIDVSEPHQHGVGGTANPAARRRALTVALLANAALFAVELIAAISFGSLALLADTAHLATDVAALGLSLVAVVLSARPASAR